jgi:hypothetical protein
MLIAILLSTFSISHSQHAILVFKKKNKLIENFWTGSTIAFQLANRDWQKGEIVRIHGDSFYIRPVVMKYSLYRTDTLYYDVLPFAVSDVYAMPKRGVLIDYKNGEWQISRSGGHQHWYWIKSGWIFRVAGAGYASVVIVNGLIEKDLSSSDNKAQLGIAAAIFITGVVLHETYKLTVRLGKKYQLQTFILSSK